MAVSQPGCSRRAVLAAGCGAAAPVLAQTPAPFVLDGTEVHALRATGLKRDYEVAVSLPAGYGQGGQRYPVVLVPDAPYAFPLVRSIARRISGHEGNLAEFILVGLSYARGDSPAQSRNRDYTPTDINAKGTRAADQGGPGPYGEAEGYRRYLSDEVFPFIARRYRADMGRKVLLGHSYGGLLGLHTLFTEPTMFSHYILGSPSLWFDKRVMFDVERAYAAARRDLPARLLLMAGALEGAPVGSKAASAARRDDMVRDVLDFERQLKAHRYPGLTVRSAIVPGEDHLTLFPALATRGLMWALPAR